LAALLLTVATANTAEPKCVLLLYIQERTMPAVTLFEPGLEPVEPPVEYRVQQPAEKVPKARKHDRNLV
jgi:hypothetical protein